MFFLIFAVAWSCWILIATVPIPERTILRAVTEVMGMELAQLDSGSDWCRSGTLENKEMTPASAVKRRSAGSKSLR